MSARRGITIAGNWKMNLGTESEASAFFTHFNKSDQTSKMTKNLDVIIFPPISVLWFITEFFQFNTIVGTFAPKGSGQSTLDQRSETRKQRAYLQRRVAAAGS